MQRPWGMLLPATALLVTAAGCQRYQRQPLDLDDYLARWQERLVDLHAAEVERSSAADAAAPLDVGDGVTLAEAERIALCFNSSVRRARQEAQVALSRAEYAGLPEDPTFEADLLRILDSVDEPWIIGAGLGFTIPLSGRLTVQQAAAEAAHDAALHEVLVEEWELLESLRQAWLEWSERREHLELIRAYVADLEEIGGIAHRLAQAGELNPSEARVLEIDRLERLSELESLEGETSVQRLRVLELLGLVPDAPIELHPSLETAPVSVDGGMPTADLLKHPQLGLSRARYEVAERELQREILKQYPDLTIGPAYEWEEGQSRIGFGFGLPLPILNANREGIAEARANRDAARLDAELVLEELASRAAQAQQKLESARARRTLLEQRMAPLVDRQIEEIRRLADLGELNVLLLENALVRSLKMQQQMLQSRAQEASAFLELRALLGRNFDESNESD